jgi:hypothetical protein
MAETKDETKGPSSSSGSSGGERTAETKKWQLEREHELRFEIEGTEKITIKVSTCNHPADAYYPQQTNGNVIKMMLM